MVKPGIVIGLALLLSSSSSAAPSSCVDAAAVRSLARLQQQFSPTRQRANVGAVKASAGVYRQYTSKVERTGRGAPDQWLLTHHGAPLWVTVRRPVDNHNNDNNDNNDDDGVGALAVLACSYAVSGTRLDEVTPAEIVRGFRESNSTTIAATAKDGVVPVSGLAGFSFDTEWRGPRLLTLVLVTGTIETAYELHAQTSAPPPAKAAAATTTTATRAP